VNDVIELPAPDYTIRIRTRHGYENNPAPRVYVADEVAQSRSTDLVEYQRQEAELGDRRWAERGIYADVDALYDVLNQAIMNVKTEIAREVLGTLPATVEGNLVAAIDRAFFSRKAGCDMCPCSPGVIAGVKLTIDGGEFDMWVETR
jgi:hypothetical protein